MELLKSHANLRPQDLSQKDCIDEDVELIQRILQRHPDAQEEFVHRFGNLIHAVLNRMSLTSEERKDLYQQVFVHLWDRDCHRFRMWQSSKGRFRSFLAIVVARLAYDYIRSASARSGSTSLKDISNLPAPEPDLTITAHRHQQKKAIDGSLCQLKPRYAEIIRLRHYQGHSYKEIAAILNITVDNVGVILARAEECLRETLHNFYPELFEEEKKKPRPSFSTITCLSQAE